MTVRELFTVAISVDSKAERRNAYRQLREIATRGTGDEAEEARYALERSAEYAKRLEVAA